MWQCIGQPYDRKLTSTFPLFRARLLLKGTLDRSTVSPIKEYALPLPITPLAPLSLPVPLFIAQDRFESHFALTLEMRMKTARPRVATAKCLS